MVNLKLLKNLIPFRFKLQLEQPFIFPQLVLGCEVSLSSWLEISTSCVTKRWLRRRQHGESFSIVVVATCQNREFLLKLSWWNPVCPLPHVDDWHHTVVDCTWKNSIKLHWMDTIALVLFCPKKCHLSQFTGMTSLIPFWHFYFLCISQSIVLQDIIGLEDNISPLYPHLLAF